MPVIAGLNEATQAYTKGDFKVALEEYLPLARQGDAEAQDKSGRILLLGKGVQANVKEGMLWLGKAEQQGNRSSAYIMGLAYLHRLAQEQVAKEIPLDAKHGVELLTKAAEDVDIRRLAAKELREFYAKGVGNIAKNNDKVTYWWEVENDLLETRAEAEKGDAKAAEILGLAYLHFAPIGGVGLKGTPVLPFRNRIAEQWLSRAARDGKISSEAAEAYGCLYLDEPGVATDTVKAKKWVESSRYIPKLLPMATAGDADAMVKIGDTYYDTCLKGKYLEDAFLWYKKAVTAGNIKRAWRLMDHAESIEEKKHWAEIAAAIKKPDGTPLKNQYGGEVLFDNLDYGSDISWGFRHAPGTRYLSLKPVQVHLRPDEKLPIIHDIGSLRLIYARELNNDDWLAVIATSRKRYPDTFGYIRYDVDKSVEEFLDQHPSYRPNRQYVYGLIGYIRKSNLASLDKIPPFPIPDRGLIPVPSLWEDIGIKEDRKFITDFSIHPYDAIVQIKTTKGSCSGAFALNSSLVITAGHCASETGERVEVIIERSPSQREVIPAQWLSYVKNYIEDWGLIKLNHRPRSPVSPLEFADGFRLSNTSQITSAFIGYPGDLTYLSRNRLGFVAPSIKTCIQDIGKHQYSEEHRSVDFSSKNCHIWFGDSGGPLLAWNPTNSRFEILGVAAQIPDGYSNEYLKYLLGNQRFNNMMYEKYKKIVAPLLNSDRTILTSKEYLEKKQVVYKGTPGVSTPIRAFREQIASLYSDDATLSLKMLEAARRAAGRTPDASPFADASDKLGFWMRDFDETYEFIRSTEEARIACVDACDKPILQKNKWTLKYGEKVNLKELAKREDTMVIYKLNAVVVGGDLFQIDKNNHVDSISRQFMNLTENGKSFNKYYQHTYKLDGGSIKKDDFPITRIARTSSLHTGPNFGGETPMSIPGGKVIGTIELSVKMNASRPPIIISSMGGSTGIPRAVDLKYSSEGGEYTDLIQQRFEKDLNNLTNGDKRTELVFYCHHSQCWMSYNSALRAIHLGYQNVYWYRGGINSWIKYGGPLDWLSRIQ